MYWHQQLLVCLACIAWGGVITMAVTNRKYGFQKKKYNYLLNFFLFYLNDLKCFEPKNTPTTPNQLTNQPTNQPTNQSRCASCIMIDDYNKR
jgi:hypothetical protein